MIGLGSNKSWLGQKPESLAPGAFEALGRVLGAGRLSPLYDSPAWPDPLAPPYVNAAARFETSLEPMAVLAALQAIEAGFGRVRSNLPEERYAPRTLDLDLLDLGGLQMATETLTLPHPRIAERDFVLLPLWDIAPEWVHPMSGETISALLAKLPSTSATRRG